METSNSLPNQVPCTTGVGSVAADSTCDGFADCSDGSDEAGCDFPCGSGAGSPTVPYSSLCDGSADCPNGEDEDGCTALCDGATPAGN
jgi:hypothetical protein